MKTNRREKAKKRKKERRQKRQGDVRPGQVLNRGGRRGPLQGPRPTGSQQARRRAMSGIRAFLYVSRKMVKRCVARPMVAHLFYTVFHRPIWKLTPQQNKEREGATAHRRITDSTGMLQRSKGGEYGISFYLSFKLCQYYFSKYLVT